ncbi:MAG: alpha/beta hydrolase [Kiritimatiellaeota bacterium]|nr:alpha/beta hydrolase [Kiritimatiellota bacterium]
MMLLSVVVGLYLLLVVVAVFFSNPIIFPAPTPSYVDSPEHPRIKSEDGNLIAIREVQSVDSNFWVLFSHGNGTDLGLIADFLESIPEKLECSLLAYDYPGYGTSSGTPSEHSVNAAAEAAYRHLREKGVPDDKIIVWGRSIGGGPSAKLAHDHKVAALILESAFMSVFRIVSKVKILPFDKFDNLAIVNDIECPVFFIHGKLDKIIPFFHGEALYEKAKSPKSFYWLNDAGHNNVEFKAGSEYWKRLGEFVASVKPKTADE